MIEKLGGKKFILAILILVLGFTYCMVTKVPFNDFKELATWIMGIFTVGNVGAYLADDLKK